MPQQRTRREPREPTERDLRQLEQRVHRLINEQRRRAKLPPLTWHERVAQAARDHSKNMAERNFFDHRDPRLGDVDQRLNRFRIEWRACGENIFMLHGYSNPAQVAVNGWMDSPGHRANILQDGIHPRGRRRLLSQTRQALLLDSNLHPPARWNQTLTDWVSFK
jgi:uncharacterized protein YkwD